MTVSLRLELFPQPERYSVPLWYNDARVEECPLQLQ